MCIFCAYHHHTLIYEDQFVYAIYDNYPVNRGHALIIPKRHIKDYFSLNDNEQKAINQAINHIKKNLDEKYHPDGYNIGINNGKAAGQTIFHLHVHLIPRYHGDLKDPTGGVRGVIPSKKTY